jgi:hypothetical protein
MLSVVLLPSASAGEASAFTCIYLQYSTVRYRELS